MRVNTANSIALGERVHKEFGSWAKARKTAVLRDGVFVLRAKAADNEPDAPQSGQAQRARKA